MTAAEAEILYRTCWQVGNLVPDPVGIAELSARWTSGRPRAAALSVVSVAGVPETRVDLPLAGRLAGIGADPGSAAADMSDGDYAYLAGYLTEAVAHYTRALRADPLCPRAWAGIALAGRKIYGGKAFRVLDERAEVAARLYEVLGPDTDIPALVRWLSSPAFSGASRPVGQAM